MSIKVTTHRGVDVLCSPSGQFYTLNDSEYGGHFAPSLEELKKKIDGAGALTQGPEKAFTLVDGSWRGHAKSKIVPCKCGKIITDPRRGAEVWITSKTNGRSKVNASEVYEDTPDNRKKAEKWLELSNQKFALGKEIDRVEESMKSLSPAES